MAAFMSALSDRFDKPGDHGRLVTEPAEVMSFW